MVDGFIDSASAYEVILVLARGKPQDSYRMEWDSALAVTAMLISTTHLKLAPNPRREGAASGAYGVFLEGLEPAISRIVLPENQTIAAVKRTRNWAGDNIHRLRSALSEFTQDSGAPNQARLWLDAHIRNEWHEHVLRRGALFDRVFAHQIARVLDVDQREILRAWSLSADAPFIAALSAERPESDDFRLLRDAFVVSALLRGRYHDYASEMSQKQVLVHPVREHIHRRAKPTVRIPIEVSNTERYLANITVAGAFAERSHNARVALWVENVLKLRRGRDQINLTQKDRDEIARDTAIDAARKFHVRVHSRLLENSIDAAIGLGSTALTSFALLPWESMALGSAMYAYSANKKVGNRLVAAAAGRRSALNRLASLMPGRIDGGS